MDHVTILPGDAGSTAVAQGLLQIAAQLGLPADVVEWLPAKGGFKVPEAVATAYAEGQDPNPEPAAVEASEDEATPLVSADPAIPAANATLNIVLPVPVAQTPAAAPPAAQAPEATGQPSYSDEEKAAAVDAVVNGGRSIASVAAELGASATSVGKWVKAANAAEGGGSNG